MYKIANGLYIDPDEVLGEGMYAITVLYDNDGCLRVNVKAEAMKALKQRKDMDRSRRQLRGAMRR